MTMATDHQRADHAAAAPFRIGERVTGMTYVPPENRPFEQPRPFEGDVVQVGSGYAGVDADNSYVWVRLDDVTECQALIVDTKPSTTKTPGAGR